MVEKSELCQLNGQAETSTEPPPSLDHRINLLGPFEIFPKLTALDYSYLNPNGSKICHWVSKFVASLVIISLLVRTISLLGVESKILSFEWAESNLFAFLGIHSVICGFCLLSWSNNGFLAKYKSQLAELRALRMKQDSQIDNYSKLHKTCILFSIPLLITVMTASIFAAFQEKFIYGGNTVSLAFCTFFSCVTFMSWLVQINVMTIYNIVNFSLNREIEYFNNEFKDCLGGDITYDLLKIYSTRHYQILKVVKLTNESLASYGRIGPLFCFFAIINGIYLTGCFEKVPGYYCVVLVLGLICSIFLAIFSLLPPAKVQTGISETANILMFDHKFENSNDQQIYQMYRVMLDRILSSNSKIYVINAFPIDSQTFNKAMFFIPNLGAILLILKKILVLNGFQA